MNLETMLKTAYELIPPPLSAMPAKYHAPISLLLHSLSTGMLAHDIAELADMEEYKDLAFVLGVTHDLHQKFVESGLSTLKKTKSYIKEKLDRLGLSDYYGYVDDALEVDACGKGNPIRNLPRELSTICHIGDMAQGRLDAYSLLYWLQEKIKEVSKDLAVGFYGVMIPQPFARSYIMQRIYDKHISKSAKSGHVALASPWGLYVIARSDELQPVVEVSWDDLRISDFPLKCNEILEMELNKKANEEYKSKLGDEISEKELDNKMWSKFAGMFYSRDMLSNCLTPLNPSLPPNIEGLFINIRFVDVKFEDVTEESRICPLCGLEHTVEYSFGVNLYPKIAGVKVTTEKWSRKLPGHIKVRGWEGQWSHGFGLDPLCALDSIAVRELNLHGHVMHDLSGALSVSISKPLPIQLLSWIALVVRIRDEYRKNPDSIPGIAPDKLSIVGGVVIDYSTATVSVPAGAPNIDTILNEIPNLGFLISLGLYPVKYLETIDTSIPDRLLVTTHGFTLVEFPVTSDKYRSVIPWVAKLLELAGELDKKDSLDILQTPPQYAPLRLLSVGSLNERMAKKATETYVRVSNLLSLV